MAGLFQHGHAEGETKSKGWFGGGGSSSSDEEREEGGHAGQAEGGPQRTKVHGSRKAVKVSCKANVHYNVTVRNSEVVLAPEDLSGDERQTWIKDESWGNRLQDDAGFPAFALVNKATGLALKHAKAQGEPVRLAEYNPEVLDETVLWTLSDDIEGGFRAIRKVNDTGLNLDAWKGDSDSGGVHDGTLLTLYKWNKGANQLWKIDELKYENPRF